MRASDLPSHYNAVAILDDNLVDRAEKVAIYSHERMASFAEVAKESRQVSNLLKKLGIVRGETIAILAHDSVEWVASYFGILRIGGVAASFNTLLTAREIVYMMNDCAARVLIVDSSLAPPILAQAAAMPGVETILIMGEGVDSGNSHRAKVMRYRDMVASQSDRSEPVATHRDDFCSLNYSSGTTGEPKGILHAHKDLILTAELVGKQTLGLTEHDRTFAVAKLFFTFGTGGNLIFPWYVGASIVLFAGSPRKPESVFDILEKFSPTVFYTSPTGYASMLAEPDFAKRCNVSSLRMCVSAGEALPAPIWQRWHEATGLQIFDGIGSTENYHMFIANRSGKVKPGSSGIPVPGYELRIVDDDGKLVPQGEIGTLLVRGETSALSYLHQYDKSRRTFRGEWLDTGDQYYVDSEGFYFHAGRSDDMLKVGGIWVSPMEVESCILQHPSVAECAVVGFPDVDNLIKPKAYVVARSGSEVSSLGAALAQHCTTHMAHYKRPRWIEIVTELPKTATGKIQRFRLRSQPGDQSV